LRRRYVAARPSRSSNTRWASRCIFCRSWVTKQIVRPRSCRLTSNVSSHSAPAASRAINGSSNSSSGGCDQCPGDGQALSHAAGKLCRQDVCVWRQAGHVEPLIGRVPCVVDSAHSRRKYQVLAERQVEYKPLSWANMPTCRRSATSRPTRWPNQRTSPPSGRSTDADSHKVVFPARWRRPTPRCRRQGSPGRRHRAPSAVNAFDNRSLGLPRGFVH